MPAKKGADGRVTCKGSEGEEGNLDIRLIRLGAHGECVKYDFVKERVCCTFVTSTLAIILIALTYCLPLHG